MRISEMRQRRCWRWWLAFAHVALGTYRSSAALASSSRQPLTSANGGKDVRSLRRPLVAQKLIDELFLGSDPLSHETVAQGTRLDEAMTHVAAKDIDMVLALAPQPVTFWLELGAFEGGSAIKTASRVKARADAAAISRGAVTEKNAPTSGMKIPTTQPAAPTSIIAVDTFLGDVRVLWGRSAEERRQLLHPDGTIGLYDRFRANLRASSHDDLVLPLPATSSVALRLVAELVQSGTVAAPQVIYLDSAHEEGEVLLELEMAWQVVAPGGVVFGDDWVLPPLASQRARGGAGQQAPGEASDEGGVQRDVLRFAEAHQSELDDSQGRKAQEIRSLGRARPGLYVSYNSFQWFMWKRHHDDEMDAARASPQAGTVFRQAAHSTDGTQAVAAFDCWSDGYQQGDCCDEQKFGPGGNDNCWDLMFTYDRCCSPRKS